MSIPTVGDEGQTISDAALLKVAKGGALIFLGMILARILGFLRQLIVIRMLSPADYGLFALGLTIVNVLVSVGSLGLYLGAQRFIANYMEKEDYPKVKGTIQSSIWITTAVGVLFMVLAMVFANSLAGFFAKPQLKSLLLIMAPTIPFQIVGMILTASFLGLHNPSPKVAIEDIGFGVVSVIAVYISLVIARSLYSPAIAISVSFILMFLASIYVFRSRFPLNLKNIKASPIAKQLLYFSLPLFLTSALYVAIGNTDTIVVGHFMASEQVGFYNAAFLLITAIPLFLGAVSIIYLPVATSLRAKKAHAESLRLYQSSTRWPFILSLPLFLTFFLFPAQTLSLLFGIKYTTAATALWILSLGSFINILLGPNGYALVAYGETRMVLYCSLAAAAIDVVLCLLLVPRIGISGAAIATATALGFSSILYSFLLWVRHKLHPFDRKYVLTILFLFAIGVALYYPLRAAIDRAHWLVLLIYPLFLIAGLLFIVLTRSISEEDRLLWRVVRDRFRR
jgi:O-antigen/teichoic acid export membrane protein